MFFKILSIFDNQDLPEGVKIQQVDIPIIYRKHRNARQLLMRLEYNYNDPLIKITLPQKGSSTQVKKFLTEAHGWLVKQLQQRANDRKSTTIFEQGAVISLLGKNVTVNISNSESFRGIYLQQDSLIIPKSKLHVKHIHAFLKLELLRYVEQKTTHFANAIDESISKVVVKTLRSRYGSCNSSGTLTFASKLIFAPIEVINYVCVHEVAHLKEMNHSKEFWRIVVKLMPTYKDQEDWIKQNGHLLNDAWKSAKL